jgi:hypothetical protein
MIAGDPPTCRSGKHPDPRETAAEELEPASVRRDGPLGKPVTIWVERAMLGLDQADTAEARGPRKARHERVRTTIHVGTPGQTSSAPSHR